MNMANRTMHDAFTLSADNIQHKYHGINSLAGGIAAQNEVYNSVHRNELDHLAREAQSQAAMTELKASLAEWRAAWEIYQSQLERGW